MNHKVLLADDSLTIQKVIKITLANQPFDLVDCLTDDDLFKKLPEVQPAIVLLDFNLSEKFSGYELASKIRAAVPGAKVLLLLGTFDSIDDSAMEKCGAADKIVKPFDSNKFIAICKRLVDNSVVEEIKFPEPKKEEFIVPKDEDQWTVSHTVEHTPTPAPVETPKASFDVRNHLNPLDLEVSDWGMSVPGVIGNETVEDKKADLPSVIGEVKSLKEHKAKNEPKVQAAADIKFPDNDDLDYPTIEELAEAKPEAPAARSKLISIDTFTPDKTAEFKIEHVINSMDESDVSSIEAQIRDEVEENLWQVDEFEDLKKEVASKIEDMKTGFQPAANDFDESLFKPLDESEEIQWTAALDNPAPESQDRVAVQTHQVSEAQIEAMIKKHVKEYMDQMFQQKVEKIAWEVIPDLAENLIRQEMTKISHKILNESN